MTLEQDQARLERELEEVRQKIALSKIVEKPKRKKKGEYLVPYDPTGNLMTWAGNGFGVEWVDNTPFMATMTLDHKIRKTHDYGSSTKFWWRDEYEHLFPMFPVSLYKAIVDGATVSEGKISGMWQVTKKGDNYGIEWQSD